MIFYEDSLVIVVAPIACRGFAIGPCFVMKLLVTFQALQSLAEKEKAG